MATKLSNIDDVRKALNASQGKPVEVEDDETRAVYVIISRDQFRDRQLRVFDNGELSQAEKFAVAAQALDDPEGWGWAAQNRGIIEARFRAILFRQSK